MIYYVGLLCTLLTITSIHPMKTFSGQFRDNFRSALFTFVPHAVTRVSWKTWRFGESPRPDRFCGCGWSLWRLDTVGWGCRHFLHWVPRLYLSMLAHCGDPHTTKEPARGRSTSLGKSLNTSGEVPSANLRLNFRGPTPWLVKNYYDWTSIIILGSPTANSEC